MSMKQRKTLFLCAMLALCANACGLKGPLYLPEGEEPAIELETRPETESEERDEAAA